MKKINECECVRSVLFMIVCMPESASSRHTQRQTHKYQVGLSCYIINNLCFHPYSAQIWMCVRVQVSVSPQCYYHSITFTALHYAPNLQYNMRDYYCTPSNCWAPPTLNISQNLQQQHGEQSRKNL